MTGPFTFSDQVIKICSKHERKMNAIQMKVKPAEHGIYPSEMLPVCAICEEFKISLVIESGRQFGYSTEILAEWFKDFPTQVISIDIQDPTTEVLTRLDKPEYKYVQLQKGDGNKLIPELVQTAGKRAVLLDGPKYTQALNLAVWLKGFVDWVFIHDMVGWNCDEWKHSNVMSTSSPEFCSVFSYLDHKFLTDLGYPPDAPGGGLAVFCLLEKDEVIE